MRADSQNSNIDHLPYLDGLRGFAAAWVFLHHVAVLNDVSLPIIKRGSLAVDLFMLLSGFLMAFHHLRKQDRGGGDTLSDWTMFWTRRIFRIAPLYFFLLAVALLIGPWLGDWRETIAVAFPDTATASARYDDQSVENVLAHITFIFGAVPHFSFRTALPDWSIGLEMQYYAAFPIIMLVWRMAGAAITAGLVTLASVALKMLFPAYFAAFPMPSMLAIKMYVFLAGMLIAGAFCSTRPLDRIGLLVLGLALLFVPPMAGIVSMGQVVALAPLIVLFAALVFNRELGSALGIQKLTATTMAFMSARPFKFLGDTSYSVYLVHLLILIPLIGALVRTDFYMNQAPIMRVAISVLLSVLPVYAFSWICYRMIEVRGIKVGKEVTKAMRPSLRHPRTSTPR
jgi:peptidoglycan/LPS O-acetylase OafA/YrhL